MSAEGDPGGEAPPETLFTSVQRASCVSTLLMSALQATGKKRHGGQRYRWFSVILSCADELDTKDTGVRLPSSRRWPGCRSNQTCDRCCDQGTFSSHASPGVDPGSSLEALLGEAALQLGGGLAPLPTGRGSRVGFL